MKNLKIALFQSNLFWENKAANLNGFEKKINSLVGDIDLIVLPEMFNTGFSMNNSLSEPMSGETVKWMLTMADKHGVHVGGSLMIEENGHYYNRMLVVSNEGEITTYDKRHLFTMADEQNHFEAGDSHSIVEINGFKINLQVCYDLRFPVWSRNKYDNGSFDYDCMIYVANWPAVRSSVWRNLLQARAAENMAFVVGVNRVGVDGTGKSYSGDSMVVGPWGSIKVETKNDQEEILYASLDMDELVSVREKFPVLNDADRFNLIR